MNYGIQSFDFNQRREAARNDKRSGRYWLSVGIVSRRRKDALRDYGKVAEMRFIVLAGIIAFALLLSAVAAGCPNRDKAKNKVLAAVAWLIVIAYIAILLFR